MISDGRPRISDWRSRQLFQLCLLSSVVCLLFGTGCTTSSRRAPGRTVVEVRPTVLPAQLISNFFVVEASLDGGAPYRFLVDTGSTVSYVTPKLAQRFAVKEKKGATPRLVRVRSAHGEETELPALTLRQLRIGASLFERVPALAYDFTDLSSHLGLQIDGIIGFPVFQHTLLTLDYLEKRLIIAPSVAAYAPPPKQTPRISTLTFGSQQGTPLIPIQMGNESFVALIDSGSDGSLSLNPAGLHPRFANLCAPAPLSPPCKATGLNSPAASTRACSSAPASSISPSWISPTSSPPSGARFSAISASPSTSAATW